MLFHFEGKIKPEDLLDEIRPLIQALLDGGITHISDMHVSLRGFSGDTECQIVDKDELISQLYFVRPAVRDTVGSPARVVRRDGSFIRERPADMPYGGLGILFGHND